MKDWYQYSHGGSLVNDYGRQLLSIYSSSRVGEFIESSARKGSGRGLLYKVDLPLLRIDREV
jgi:hypothetical protein